MSVAALPTSSQEIARGMEPQEYTKMAQVEDRMWWYQALHRNIHALVTRHLRPGARDLLDAGCGTGGLLRFLSRREPELRSSGIDIWGPACALTSQRTGRPVACASANQLPVRDAGLDCVVSADVLEEGGVEPEQAIAEAYRCLRSGGCFVASATAYAWLRSYHDERVGAVRRFTRGELRRSLEAAGFQVSYSGYWNTFLFPLVVIRRKLLPPSSGESDVREYGSILDKVFRSIMRIEGGLLRLGIRFPFGVSVLVVGTKP